jgi:hypothetical protein
VGGTMGANNIVIGTSISFKPGRKDSINIGGIIFGTGSYFAVPSAQIETGSVVDGKIGINVEDPTYNFQVSGTVAFDNLSDNALLPLVRVVMADSNGQLFYTASSAIGGGGVGTPGGNNTEIQYNNNGAFGGLSVLTYEATVGAGLVGTGSFTGSFSGSLFGTSSYADSASIAITAQTSSYPINYQSGYLYSVSPGMVAGTFATASNNSGSIFLGYQAAQNVGIGVYNSNFLGYTAGSGANFAYQSNFIGYSAGTNAYSASDSNFIGFRAGSSARNAYGSNFIGNAAGQTAFHAYYSNFLGYQAGNNAYSASYSNFFGQAAGQNALFASNSFFAGVTSGYQATYADNSTFIGYQAGALSTYANN